MKSKYLPIFCFLGILIIKHFDNGKFKTLSVLSVLILLIISIVSVVLINIKAHKEGTLNKNKLIVFVIAIILSLIIYSKGLLYLS